MTKAGVGVFPLAIMFSVVAAAAGNTCSLDPLPWTCPTQPSQLSLGFTAVTVDKCGQSYDKGLFTTLTGLKYPAAEQSKTYTAVMVDPDAPRHTDGQAWLHWIRAGLTSADLAAGTLTGGQDIVEYRPPTPPQNTGVHRYFVYVFEESQAVQQEDLSKRGKFDLSAYAARQKLCGPVASNMFQTEF